MYFAKNPFHGMNPSRAGRKQYLQKQNEFIFGDVNLVEIDLLRDGCWVMATSEYLRCVGFSLMTCMTRSDHVRSESQLFEQFDLVVANIDFPPAMLYACR
jgi:Protein of unknown function (DUF4058)